MARDRYSEVLKNVLEKNVLLWEERSTMGHLKNVLLWVIVELWVRRTFYYGSSELHSSKADNPCSLMWRD